VHDLIILFSNEQNAFDHFEPLCFDWSIAGKVGAEGFQYCKRSRWRW
jgi:hypothetical protein